MHEGQPLTGARVGLVQVERAPHVFLGDYEALTDAQGAFCFEHVPAGRAYHVHGVMGELEGGLGASAHRRATGPSEASTMSSSSSLAPLAT